MNHAIAVLGIWTVLWGRARPRTGLWSSTRQL